ncbi:Lysozyme [Trachymyrmex cornetzi]|uniref:lysozyme n=1 Tax=Trachymyrmex cornetzi TaxID=471704 RepID=A0A151JN45_9HYME|nr:Lysozyme [Trachymyrmex cornetzi]
MKCSGHSTRIMKNIIIIISLLFVTAQEISQKCIGCICEATSGCNITVGCDGPVCGPFYITKQYWIDAGRPYVNGGQSDNDNEDTFRSCAKDAYCAARTVENYMAIFSRDCTGNGIINCDDYVRIHRLGASGCTNTLHSVYENTYKLCIQTVGEY